MLVHGLFGSPKRTWTAKHIERLEHRPGVDDSDSDDEGSVPRLRQPEAPIDNMDRAGGREVFWPQMLLPQVMPTARIMTWGYDVGIDSLLRGTSTASVFRHAGMLLSDLETARRGDGAALRPIIFIAHSLGGIVVKDAICISQTNPLVGRSILPSTKGVLFLGTPHKGSQMATVARAAFNISRLFLRSPNTNILRTLEEQSDVLERISWGFGQILASGRIRVHSFREELDSSGISIVSAQSAIIGYFHETHGDLHASHRNMAKFCSLEDKNFCRVQAVLDRWLDEILEAGREGPNHGSGERSTVKEDASGSNANFPKGLVFDEVYKMCLMSLSTVDGSQRFQNVEPPFANTYVWLFNEEHGFSRWLRGEIGHPVFWVQGKPASGKSTAMKYSAQSSATMAHLQRYRGGNWTIVTFFFHDRGSLAQKSIDNMAREVLFQILSQVRPVFEDIYEFLLERLPGLETEVLGPTVWTPQLIQGTVEAIGLRLKQGFNLNLCIFIDALDEHGGDHKGLLRFVTSLRRLDSHPSIRLRICLASRPENLFKQEFWDCPTLVIHHHTVNDIRAYTEGRISTAATRVRLSTSGNATLRQLSTKVIALAQGVFLWVKLVVDELVEGLQEGDGWEELAEILDTAPSELNDLYGRALNRSRRTSTRALTKTREEGYYMFRIAAAWRQPFTIYSLLNASMFLSRRKPLSIDFRTMTIGQLDRRIYNRSAGLLEGVDPDHSLFTGRTVRFIHQTTKDYITSGNGHNVISAWVPDIRRESGSMLIFRYFVHLIVSLGRPVTNLERLDLHLVYREFVYFATQLEAEEKRPIVPEVEQALLDLPPSAQERLLVSLWDTPASNASFDTRSWKDVRDGTLMGTLPQKKAFMVLFSIYLGLHLSITHYLASGVSSITENDSLGLLQVAAWNSKRPGASVTTLLQAGLRKNISETAWKDHFLAHVEAEEVTGILQELTLREDAPGLSST